MVNLVHMPVSRERMEHYQNRHLRQIEHAHKQWEGREMKAKNNNMRRQWLQRQSNANYRNDYDRIRSELSHRVIPAQTKAKLQQREGELSKLVSSGTVKLNVIKAGRRRNCEEQVARKR